MSHRSKIIASIFILVGLFFLVSKVFNLGPYSKAPICPPGLCHIYQTDQSGKPIGTTIKQEEGRLRTDFASSTPPGFPKGLPFDPKPLRVAQSYVETMKGNDNTGEPSHSQITYAYITSQNAKMIADNFKGYLRINGYEVTVSKGNSDSEHFLSGHIISGPSIKSINISVVGFSQFERFVTVSMIIAPKTKI